jgi:hypothetical protein
VQNPNHGRIRRRRQWRCWQKTAAKTSQGPITLQDPDRKYALSMVAREEVFHDTRLPTKLIKIENELYTVNSS